jgi:uncharacterized delta-60 repeat protein
MKKVLLALGFVVSCIAAHAQAGSLDLSFGTVGYVRTNFPVNAPTTYVSSAIQADGKIVTIGSVAGDFAIARYNTDGTPDNSFSGDGMTTVSFGSNDVGSDVAIAPDGKIVVVGTLGSAIGMARLNPDGSLDNSLSGNLLGGPGKAITPLGVFGGFAVAVSLQGDGKIVVGGWELGPFVRGIGVIEHIVVVRYNIDGSNDAGFGVNGIRTIIFTPLDRAADMVVQSDGKIVITGTAGLQNPLGAVNIIVSRLNPDGSADPAFNGGGVTTDISYDVAGAIALQTDGKIIVAGSAGASALLLRYNPDGSLDNSFSGDGKLILDPGVGPGFFSAVVVQPDGKIIAGGTSADNFVLMRFNADGTPDNSFSGDGIVTTDFENGIDILEDLQVWNNRVYAVGRTTVNGINAGLVAAYLLNDVCQLSVTIPDAVTLNNGVQPNTVYIGYQPASDLTLSVNVTGANGALSYLWSNGATTPTITVTPTVSVTYTVTVTDASGCSGTASKLINVVDVRCGNKLDKVMICKVPPGNPANASTNCISASAVPAHLNNGSYLGNCNVMNRIVTSAENIEEIPAALALRALPNPSRSFFILDISSSKREKAELTVRDIAGRQVEKRIVMPGNKLQLGSAYRAGVYLVELRQGNERVILKLIKLGE